jgi:hypothetical protein
MPLESYVGLLFAAGGGLGYFPPPALDSSSDADTWVARFMAGDPYDDSVSTNVVSEIRRYHSPLGIEAGLPRSRREQPAAVFDNTAWSDDLTRTTEIIRWRNDVLSRYPDAEIDLLFSHGAGHPRASGTTPDLEALQKAFFDRLLQGHAGKRLGVRTFTQSCAGNTPAGPIDTDTWAEQHPGEIRYTADPVARTITGIVPDHYSARVDAVAGAGCVTVPALDSPAAATYRFNATPPGGYTLMGAPTVIARIATNSPWAQVDARLWDVGPDGNQTFVSRVAYRPRAGGLQVFQLQATGWKFAPGHIAKLELLGQDSPYVRHSNTPFTATISDVRLRLPVREAPGGAVLTPARPLDRRGRPIRRCSTALAADLREHCRAAARRHS